jgi:hypothetical protein
MPPLRDILGTTIPDMPLGRRVPGVDSPDLIRKFPGKEEVERKWHQSKAFPRIGPLEMESGVTARMLRPELMDQATSSLCGPAVLNFWVARTSPQAYETYVRTLYHDGVGTLGAGLVVRPGHDCRHVRPTHLHAADWVALACLRDSENSVFDYDDEDDAVAGITLPSTLAGWMGRVGAGAITNETNLYFTKGEENLREANQLKRAGRAVCLLINGDAVEYENLRDTTKRGFFSQTFTIPNHWVALTSDIDFQDGKVTFSVFTWGTIRVVGPLPIGVWLQSYYGYVGCRL